MIKKRGPCVNMAPKRGGSLTVADVVSEARDRRKPKRILFYPGKGVVVENPGRARHGPGGVRGKVVKWSSSSRRRMRRFLIEHRPPDGWYLFGASFTIPGPVLPKMDCDALWVDFCRRLEHRGCCAVWRVEVQERGARHWHTIVGMPPTADLTDDCESGWSLCAFKGELSVRSGFALQGAWWGALERLGPHKYDPPYAGKNGSWQFVIPEVKSLMQFPGAREHAVVVQGGGGRGAWLRYLQDHSSKSKQEQEVDAGRHWGKIGKKHFVTVEPEVVDDLSHKQFHQVVRWMQRLATPSFPRACVFGRSLGHRCRRGSWGESTWFSRPETIRRFVDYAKISTS